MKPLLCDSPILRASDFVLAIDASPVGGVGSVLLQEREDQGDHAVALFSKKLTPA